MSDNDLSRLGEFGLIDLIKQDTINDSSSVITGIGDDAAVVLATPKKLQVLSADMLVEGVHFDRKTTTPWQLGYKAVAVNLSDIAAMGAIPKHVLVSLALSKDIDTDFVVNLYKGMKEICREFGVNIVGGDTVSCPAAVVINVSVVGEVDPSLVVRRSGAKPGDVVAVTGKLGSSGGGLDLLLQGDWEQYDFAWPLVTAHLTPFPQVKAGQRLAALGATSMNDISDGLASEVNEIAAASGVGICVQAADIPVADELQQAAALYQKTALDYALYGGEDYQLVFTMDKYAFARLRTEDIGVAVTAIGTVKEKAFGVQLLGPHGAAMPLEPRGYNHFRR